MTVPGLIRAIYDAFREKRLADVFSSLSDDFCLVVRARDDTAPNGHNRRDMAETRELLRRFADSYDILSYDTGPIIVTGDEATAQPQVRYRNKKSGDVIETKSIHRWRVRDGEAVELQVVHSLPDIEPFLKKIEDGNI